MERVFMRDCGDGVRRASAGSFSPYAAKTSAYTILATDAGKTFSNRAAVASVTLTLPTAKEGFFFRIDKVAGYPVVIARAASESIDRVAGNATIPASAAGLFTVVSDGTDWHTTNPSKGTSAAPLSSATADENHLTVYTKNTATTGTSRQQYLRHYLAGAGNSGECARIFSTVLDVAAAGAHGAHISLSFGSTGSVTGLGVAGRTTLQIPNVVMAAGTYAAVQSEIFSDGASSDPTGVTELSFFRVSNSGNATGVGKTDDKAFLLTLDGGAIGAGNLMAVKSSAAVSHTLRMKGPDGGTYYLMVSSAQ